MTTKSRNLHGVCKIIRQHLKSTHKTKECTYCFSEVTAFSALMSSSKKKSGQDKRPRSMEGAEVFKEGLEDLCSNYKRSRSANETNDLKQLEIKIETILKSLTVLRDIKTANDQKEITEIVESKRMVKQLHKELTTMKKRLNQTLRRKREREDKEGSMYTASPFSNPNPTCMPMSCHVMQPCMSHSMFDSVNVMRCCRMMLITIGGEQTLKQVSVPQLSGVR